jgi:hypothetical protein
VQIAAAMNRATGKVAGHFRLLFHYVASMVLMTLLIVVLELTSRIMLHSGLAYRTLALIVPMAMAMACRGSGARWSATMVAGFYTAIMLGLLWILPLFPAEPRLGPVFHAVTQFIPPGFPLLILAPALVVDLVRQRTAGWSDWKQAIVGGLVFSVVFLAVQWPFTDFLMSPGARNGFFGSNYYDYFQSPNGYLATNRYVPLENAAQFRTNMMLAPLFAMLSAWLGLGVGNWLKRVRR